MYIQNGSDDDIDDDDDDVSNYLLYIDMRHCLSTMLSKQYS